MCNYDQYPLKRKNSVFTFCVGKNPVLPSCIFLSCVSPLLSHSHNTSLLTLMVTKYVGFLPPTKQFSMTPAECSTVYLHSDTVMSYPTSLGLSLTRLLPPYFRQKSQIVGAQVTHNFHPTSLQIGGSHDPLLGFQ